MATRAPLPRGLRRTGAARTPRCCDRAPPRRRRRRCCVCCRPPSPSRVPSSAVPRDRPMRGGPPPRSPASRPLLPPRSPAVSGRRTRTRRGRPCRPRRASAPPRKGASPSLTRASLDFLLAPPRLILTRLIFKWSLSSVTSGVSSFELLRSSQRILSSDIAQFLRGKVAPTCCDTKFARGAVRGAARDTHVGYRAAPSRCGPPGAPEHRGERRRVAATDTARRHAHREARREMDPGPAAVVAPDRTNVDTRPGDGHERRPGDPAVLDERQRRAGRAGGPGRPAPTRALPPGPHPVRGVRHLPGVHRARAGRRRRHRGGTAGADAGLDVPSAVSSARFGAGDGRARTSAGRDATDALELRCRLGRRRRIITDDSHSMNDGNDDDDDPIAARTRAGRRKQQQRARRTFPETVGNGHRLRRETLQRETLQRETLQREGRTSRWSKSSVDDSEEQALSGLARLLFDDSCDASP